jgi:hypothetical protein
MPADQPVSPAGDNGVPRDEAEGTPPPAAPDATPETSALDQDATRAPVTRPAGGPGTTPTAPMAPIEGWTGRARVPVSYPRETVIEQWAPEQHRRWLRPVVLGLLVVAALVASAIAFALVPRHQANQPAPPPSPSHSASPSASPTPSPSHSPSPSKTVTTVALPRLQGLDLGSAESILNGLGLTYLVVSQPSTADPPGTVESTDPASGTQVPVGSRITLVVAAPASSSPSSSPSPSGSTG